MEIIANLNRLLLSFYLYAPHHRIERKTHASIGDRFNIIAFVPTTQTYITPHFMDDIIRAIRCCKRFEREEKRDKHKIENRKIKRILENQMPFIFNETEKNIFEYAFIILIVRWTSKNEQHIHSPVYAYSIHLLSLSLYTPISHSHSHSRCIRKRRAHI